MEPVKVAVIGCGMICDAYLSTMTTRFKILKVVGCYDRHPERAQEKAEKYGIRAMSLDEIVGDPTIEIVVNLTTPASHYEVIKMLLEAGKHVYTEKVLTIDLDQAKELVLLADQKKLRLGAAPDTFLGAAVQTARTVVDSGMIGEISSCYCALNRDGSVFASPTSFTVKPGGGIGFDVGIYPITALLSILGPVHEVTGIVKTRKPDRQVLSAEKFGEHFQIENENLMAGTMVFDRGTVGTILFDGNSTFLIPEQPALVLLGSMGVMYMADPNQFGGDVKVIIKGNNEPMVMQQSHAYTEESRGLGVSEMAWSLRLGRKHRASAEMAYHALEILHGMVRSSQTKSTCVMQSTFEQLPAITRGYAGQKYFTHMEEYSLSQ
jgi:predicted dehydrogenase